MSPIQHLCPNLQSLHLILDFLLRDWHLDVGLHRVRAADEVEGVAGALLLELGGRAAVEAHGGGVDKVHGHVVDLERDERKGY